MLAKCIQLASLLVPLAVAQAKPGVEKLGEKFERPIWIGQPDGISDKLYVAEQAGKVWAIDAKTGARSEKPFLDLSGIVTRKDNEQGLLGVAFAPDFKTSGRLYVNYSDKSNHDCISGFTADKDRQSVDPGSEDSLLRIDDPYGNHNGGWIAFGPDGMLYTALGDGGSGNDPKNNGQSLNTHLGKILRLDVSAGKGYTVPKDNPFVGKADVKPEIWAYGLRNPWRCSFDRKTGDFWIGDVGQNLWEEINYLPKGKASGANFGWRLREGEILTPSKNNDVGGEAPKGAIEPVYVYKHGMGKKEGISVTGGYVYRGPVKELAGRYVFADYQNPRIWSFELKRDKASDIEDHTDDLQPEGGRINLISSFGEDNAGNLYIVDHTGPVYRVIDK